MMDHINITTLTCYIDRKLVIPTVLKNMYQTQLCLDNNYSICSLGSLSCFSCERFTCYTGNFYTILSSQKYYIYYNRAHGVRRTVQSINTRYTILSIHILFCQLLDSEMLEMLFPCSSSRTLRHEPPYIQACSSQCLHS